MMKPEKTAHANSENILLKSPLQGGTYYQIWFDKTMPVKHVQCINLYFILTQITSLPLWKR